MIEETDYHGWKATVLSTDAVELVIPHDIGPRVIACRLKGGPNLFAEREGELGQWGEEEWRIRGGHRLWLAPENSPRTYQPDNAAVSVTTSEDGRTVRMTQPLEAKTGILKSLTLEILNKTSFRITHKVKNAGLWPLRFSPWAISVMAHGGYAVIPFDPFISHEECQLPRSVLIPWTYTDFGNPIWRFASSHLGVETSLAETSQKIGIGNYPGWAAYWQEGGTFVKYAQVNPKAVYPDNGATFELYCCEWMVELETLSPLTEVMPGETASHVEYWGVFADLQKPDSEAVYTEKFRPVVEHWLAHTPA